MKQKNVSRRAFMINGASTVALGTVASAAVASGTMKKAADAAAIEAKDLVKEDNPLAKGLKYVMDATKAPERKTDRAGVKAADQFCEGCQLFTMPTTLKGTKEGVGKCQMIPTGYVKSKGWCNSWIKKA